MENQQQSKQRTTSQKRRALEMLASKEGLLPVNPSQKLEALKELKTEVKELNPKMGFGRRSRRRNKRSKRTRRFQKK